MLRIVSKAASVEGFVQAFSRLCDRDSVFIMTPKPKDVGTKTGFLLTLASGEPMLAGEGEVVETYRTKDNRYGSPGMKLRFGELEDGSRAVLGRLLAARAKSIIPLPPPPSHKREMRLGTVPPRSNHLGEMGQVGSMASSKLSDSAVEAMAECSLYDEPDEVRVPAAYAAPHAPPQSVPHAPPQSVPHAPPQSVPHAPPQSVPYAPVAASQAPAAPYPPGEVYPAQQAPYTPLGAPPAGPPGDMPAWSVDEHGNPVPMPPVLPPPGSVPPPVQPDPQRYEPTELVSPLRWRAVGMGSRLATLDIFDRLGVNRRTAGRIVIGVVVFGLLVAFAIWGNSTATTPATAGAPGMPDAHSGAPGAAVTATGAPGAAMAATGAPGAAMVATGDAGPGDAPEPLGDSGPEEAGDTDAEAYAVAAAAAPQEPECAVRIGSAPKGATVLLDKRELGKTPLETTLPCGDVELEFRRSRWLPATLTATLTLDGNNRIFAKLERPVATLAITSTPSGATVTVDGKKAGQTPASVTGEAYRTVEVVVSKSGYKPFKKRVQLKPPRTKVRATLTQASKTTRRPVRGGL